MSIFRVSCLTIILFAYIGCAYRPERTMPKKDINEVLRENDNKLLAIPGVVGVYVGLKADGKTPCLKVMVDKKIPGLERGIPKQIEGYTVLVEESGPIRPIRK